MVIKGLTRDIEIDHHDDGLGEGAEFGFEIKTNCPGCSSAYAVITEEQATELLKFLQSKLDQSNE